MWPIGHVAGAYLLFSLYDRRFGNEGLTETSVAILLFGSLLPDFLDKPLAWYMGVLPTGRSLSHSILVIVPLAVIVWSIARRYGHPEWGIAFAIGVFSHLVLDALPALWRPESSMSFLLYPIIPQEPYEEGAPSVISMLLTSLTDPYFFSEFGILALAVVLWRADGYPGLHSAHAVVDRGRSAITRM